MNQATRFIRGQFLLACILLSPNIITIDRSFFYFRPIKIAEVKNSSIDEKRDIFNTFDTKDQSDQGFPLDPLDLVNRLKQAGAMNDATTPSDALDEALNAFEEYEY